MKWRNRVPVIFEIVSILTRERKGEIMKSKLSLSTNNRDSKKIHFFSLTSFREWNSKVKLHLWFAGLIFVILMAGIIVVGAENNKLDVTALSKLDFPYFSVNLTEFSGCVSVVVLISILLLVYIKKYENELLDHEKHNKLLTIFTIILLAVILSKIITLYGIIYNSHLPYPILLVPTALAAIIIAVLIGTQISIITTFMIDVMIAIINYLAGSSATLESFILILCTGIVAAISLPEIKQRKELIKSGLYVCTVTVVIVTGISLLKQEFSALLENSVVGLAGGLAVTFLAPGLLPVFEFLAKTTTDIKLLELSDFKHLMLKELESKAPGTYHHSINVSKLAEAAARAIDANALLVKVGAYYHDIGKIKHPEYFSENQKDSRNIHDHLGPQMSAKIIAAHVTDGIKMAKKHKLPPDVIDMIPQHHGTSLISFFYNKAKEDEKHVKLNEINFRYPGPKPQSKEAAIMLLADSVEAASRSMKSTEYKELEAMIERVINRKIIDNQLDESDITLNDIRLISDSLLQVLSSMCHSRIEYPEDYNEEKSPILKAAMSSESIED